MNYTKEKESPEFNINDRGYNVKAFYLLKPRGDALIQVSKDDIIIKEFFFPSYKIWNIAAHFSDIVDSELRKNTLGYKIAASTGL